MFIRAHRNAAGKVEFWRFDLDHAPRHASTNELVDTSAPVEGLFLELEFLHWPTGKAHQVGRGYYWPRA